MRPSEGQHEGPQEVNMRALRRSTRWPSEGQHAGPSDGQQEGDTFFRTPALYRLEDLLLLKTSYSRSTERETTSLSGEEGDGRVRGAEPRG